MMKLWDYAILINSLAKKYPRADVVYSIDDEGNEFKPVYFTPSAGTMVESDFYHEGTKLDKPVGKPLPVNTVCIN